MVGCAIATSIARRWLTLGPRVQQQNDIKVHMGVVLCCAWRWPTHGAYLEFDLL